MGDMGEVDPSEIVGEVVEKALDSEPVRNLLGPVTNNIGQIFGLISDVVRFYTEQNLQNVFGKWHADRKGKPLSPEEFNRVLPLLRDAAMQSNDELHERWASLLENVANEEIGVLPSFGQTLSQITPEEARYLDRVWERATSTTFYNTGKRHGRNELSYYNLVDLYAPNLQAPNPAEMQIFGNRMSPEQIAAYDKMTHFELILHDLERLSLLEKKTTLVSDSPTKYEVGGETISIPSIRSGTKTSYALTQYGVNFIIAVHP